VFEPVTHLSILLLAENPCHVAHRGRNRRRDRAAAERRVQQQQRVVVGAEGHLQLGEVDVELVPRFGHLLQAVQLLGHSEITHDSMLFIVNRAFCTFRPQAEGQDTQTEFKLVDAKLEKDCSQREPSPRIQRHLSSAKFLQSSDSGSQSIQPHVVNPSTPT